MYDRFNRKLFENETELVYSTKWNVCILLMLISVTLCNIIIVSSCCHHLIHMVKATFTEEFQLLLKYNLWLNREMLWLELAISWQF
jgi:ABC-type siderophore export system fused ATPase/permease subunit